jgi:hypothetical protein
MYLSKGRGSNELRNLGCYPIRDESLFARREIPGLGRPDDGLMIGLGVTFGPKASNTSAASFLI